MAIRKSIDPTLIGTLIEGTTNQVVSGGTPKSEDPNFPVFKTPLDKDLIVYFPKVCVSVVDGQEVYNPLISHVHAVKKGKQFLSYRCINGLSGGAYTEQLGYDGSCPFCDGMADCWDLYNLKMSRKAMELGIDVNNDPTDAMKPYRSQFVTEMAIKRADEYVTFPIVVISDTGTIPQDPNNAKLETFFVEMRKDTFVQKIMDPLTKQAIPINSPGGMYFKWCFTYDTKGKQANVRDAAKNAQYLPIIDAQSNQVLSVFTQAAEEKAKEFTNIKAATVLVMNEFFDKDYLQSECDAVLADTKRTLAVLNAGISGMGAPALPVSDNTMGSGVANALASFGVAQQSQAPAQEVAQTVPAGGFGTAVQTPMASTQSFAGFGA